jgi:hypothetical protein
MYKAWLEALGVWDLASINMLETRKRVAHTPVKNGSPLIYDLDSNVGYYADGHGLEVFESRFGPQSAINARDLGPDFSGAPREKVEYLVGAFSNSVNGCIAKT